jgi:hypothetical protein
MLPPTRIVDRANAASLPGVDLDLTKAEKIALRRQHQGRPGEGAALCRRSLVRQTRVPAGPIDEREEGS